MTDPPLLDFLGVICFSLLVTYVEFGITITTEITLTHKITFMILLDWKARERYNINTINSYAQSIKVAKIHCNHTMSLFIPGSAMFLIRNFSHQ